MSGHSKWHNIQRRKGKQDVARGQLFTKLSRDIFTAAREGGGNPETNFRLKSALDKAKENNLPADSIARTLAKATGSESGVAYEELLYEGYGPGGVAVLLEIVTDNRNRTAADVRHIFAKRGGNLGESGSVAWMFRRVGRLEIARDKGQRTAEELLLAALEAGADDVQEEDDRYVVLTPADLFAQVRDALETAGYPLDDTLLGYEPISVIAVDEDRVDDVVDLLAALEAHDDVQNVYANIAQPENV